MAAAKLLLPRALLADGRRPEEVHSKAGRSNLGKASAVLYDDHGDAREARLVLDEPDWSVQVTTALSASARAALMPGPPGVDPIGSICMNQALCESDLSSHHTVGARTAEKVRESRGMLWKTFSHDRAGESSDRQGKVHVCTPVMGADRVV